MRILLDLQGVQTPGSRNRGMGRYSMSLAKNMLRHGQGHDFHVVLNGAFMDAVEWIRSELQEWVPQDNFHIFPAITPTAHINRENDSRRIAAEICREAFIANIQPDIVHISSLFEGLFDDSVSSIGRLQSCPVAVTLYDLIPLIHRELYLQNHDVERWYEDRLLHLRRANLLLAISRSSAQEAVDYLNFPVDRSINIGADVDPQFESSPIPADRIRQTHSRLGVTKPFVMYTGGIDWRKNIEGLLEAYSNLPTNLRRKHQLVIVCSIQQDQKHKLENLAQKLGLGSQELLLTGFVSDEDLITLYKTCKLFVFPSWHEGFGLPPLEAMRCGAAVIGGNLSSLPEVIGLQEALFDPRNEADMRERLRQGLVDSGYRDRLVEHGSRQSRKFSWTETGKRALQALVSLGSQRSSGTIEINAPTRQRLAFVSPMPPAASGIADYSAELIRELSRHYDIEIVVKDEPSANSITDPFVTSNLPVRTIDWMKSNFSWYDRVLYQFGNSDHHNHMLAALPDYPGVVVLHDFFLSGLISFEQYHYKVPDAWFEATYRSHGYSAIAFQHNASDLHAAVMKYPANRDVVTQAMGVIVHSEHSKDLARQWLGKELPENWRLIPHLRQPVHFIDRKGARERLNIAPDEFVVSSFGFVNPTKLSRRILDAWLKSPLAEQRQCKLIFVGANHPGDYGAEMLARIREAGHDESIRIVGWTDQALFRDYLAASDVAVQLRTLSRGETSGTVLDSMNHRLATVVNAHGSMADLPSEAVVMLPDEFTDDQLIEALSKLYFEPDFREQIAERGKARIERDHSPRLCAEAYAHAIESAYSAAKSTTSPVIDELRNLDPEEWTTGDIRQVGMAAQVATERAPPTSYLDVTEQLDNDQVQFSSSELKSKIRELFAEDLPRRLEPVFRDSAGWRYARKATFDAIGMGAESLTDDPVVFASSSDLLTLEGAPDKSLEGQDAMNAPFVRSWKLIATQPRTKQPKVDHPLAAALQKLGFTMTIQNAG
jgi:glycosyltransferase involved in cell wall biosynthesis